MVAPTVDIAILVSQHNSEVFQYHFTTHDSFHSVELNYVFGAPFRYIHFCIVQLTKTCLHLPPFLSPNSVHQCPQRSPVYNDLDVSVPLVVSVDMFLCN